MAARRPVKNKKTPSKSQPRMPDEILDADPEVDSDSEIETDSDAEIEASALPVARDSTGPDLDVSADMGLLETQAISPTDPLRKYLDDLKHYALLTPEEEFRLAVKLKETGDLEAARRLVTANLRLVVKIAFEYRNFYSNVLDLVQEGNVGLMKAVSKYDHSKGARLSYYASWWIRSYILKYLLDNFRLVKIGTTQAQKKLFYHLMREKQRLEAQGIVAGPKLLADRLDVREKDVVEMEQRLSSRGGEVSIDSPLRGGEADEGRSTTFGEFLRDETEGVDSRMEREQLIEMLKERLIEFEPTLSEKERKVLKERLLAEEPKTLQEIADQYGLSRERARQIEVSVITKLRQFLKQTDSI